MAGGRDTDRLAGDLLKAMMGSMRKPVAGSMQPQVDEKSMLSTIKNFLNQSPTVQSTQATPSATGWMPESAWEELYQRQEQEREAMYSRQARELDDLRQRQKREMEAMAGISPSVEKLEAEPALRPLPRRRAPAAQKQDTSSKASGIVPGKNIGRWAVKTEKGTKNLLAVSEEQALREARRAGLDPKTARLVELKTYNEEELKEMYSDFGRPGRRESAQAEFERAIKLGLIPEDAEFELLENREWGYRVGTGRVLRKSSDLFRRLRRKR